MIIKRQALADVTYADTAEVVGMADNAEATNVVEALREKNYTLAKKDAEQWTLYVDGASNDSESGADIMLINLEGHKIHCALCFEFKASNNEAKYKALIAGLHLAKELQARNIQIYSDSQLVVNQVNDIYLARGERMVA